MYLKQIVCLDTVCGACLGFGFRIFAVGVGFFCGREGVLFSPRDLFVWVFSHFILFYFISIFQKDIILL